MAATANGQSMLRVNMTDNSPITVSVDGRYFNKRGTSITVGDLPPGIHSIRIFGAPSSRWGRGYQEVIYRGRVRTSPGMVTLFTYDPYNGGVQQREEPTGGPYAGNTPRGGYDQYKGGQYTPNGQGQRQGDDVNNDRGQNRGDDIYDDRRERNDDRSAAPVPDNDGRNKKADDDYAPPAGGTSAGASPISMEESTLTDAETKKLKTRTNAKATDTEKMKLLKDELKKEKISTFQVSVIMDWFTFESSKVDFAKWAYDITTDKDNFADLASKFTYKDSQTDLDKFLETKR